MPEKPVDVDRYLEIGCGRCKLGGTSDCKVHFWTNELTSLRTILLQTELCETIKWSVPCYTHRGRNIVMLSALKENATLSFFRGAELADPEKILEKPGQNSRFARNVKFTDMQRIASLKPVILNYVREAIELEESGKKPASKGDELPCPVELNEMLDSDPVLKVAFAKLTPGRQRGYLIHFSSAKQPQTRISRIQKCRAKILEGKGWNER